MSETINIQHHVTPITVSFGDGEGPEIMEHVLTILQQAKARISINTVDIGENFYKREHYSGIPDSAWQTIAHHPVIFMAPSKKPEGDEYHDLLQTLCRCLELHSVVAPLSHLPQSHVVVGRNEHAFQQTLSYRLQEDVVEELRIFTDAQTKNLIFHAKTCAALTQLQNIYSITSSTTALSSNRLEANCQSILADADTLTYTEHHGTLAQFLEKDNEAGVLISQEAGLLNSLALMHDAKRRGIGYLGAHYLLFTGTSTTASFEGQLHAAILMLIFLGQADIASRLHHSWLAALEENPLLPTQSHADYTSAILAVLKAKEGVNIPALYAPLPPINEHTSKEAETTSSHIIGAELTLNILHQYKDTNALAECIAILCNEKPLQLQLIASRGFPIWPRAEAYVFGKGDYITVRFLSNQSPKQCAPKDIISLLEALEAEGIAAIASRYLYVYDDHVGFSVL